MSGNLFQTAPVGDKNRLYTPRKFNRVSRTRFARDRTAGLIAHLGGSATRAQLTLIQRVVRNEWDLLRLDQKMDEGELSAHAMRTRLAMETRLRLDLRELGLRAAEPKAESLDEIIREHDAAKATETAVSPEPEEAA